MNTQKWVLFVARSASTNLILPFIYTIMITRDFHGWSVDATVKEIDRIIGDIRQSGGHETCDFITGHGVIQEHLLFVLREQYMLHPQVKMSNSGVITVIVE